MTLSLLLFYCFSTILIFSSLAVAISRNTIYGVMFLIFSFVNAACLFIIAGSEYIAMLLIVVYVGAIAVLFLFVVMMLNVDIKKSASLTRKKPLLIMMGIFLFSEIYIITKFSSVKFYDKIKQYPINEHISNANSIGNILYTDFVLPFQMAGVILFIAMIGAIVLSIAPKDRFVRKQNISDQVLRNKAASIELKNIKSGSNLDI